MMWVIAFAGPSGGPGEILERMLSAMTEPERHELKKELDKLIQYNPNGIESYIRDCSAMSSSSAIECLYFATLLFSLQKKGLIGEGVYHYGLRSAMKIPDDFLSKKTIDDLTVFVELLVNNGARRKTFYTS